MLGTPSLPAADLLPLHPIVVAAAEARARPFSTAMRSALAGCQTGRAMMPPPLPLPRLWRLVAFPHPRLRRRTPAAVVVVFVLLLRALRARTPPVQLATPLWRGLAWPMVIGHQPARHFGCLRGCGQTETPTHWEQRVAPQSLGPGLPHPPRPLAPRPPRPHLLLLRIGQPREIEPNKAELAKGSMAAHLVLNAHVPRGR